MGRGAAGREDAADRLQPLFETKEAGKGRVAYRLFAGMIMEAICAIWLYRIQQLIDDQGGRSWACIGMFMAELWFSFYSIINLPVRFNVCRCSPFKERLSSRFSFFLSFFLLFSLFFFVSHAPAPFP